MNRFTLIGVGNQYRRDDGAGWEIAERIKAKALPDVEVIMASGEGAALMESMQGKKHVILFDAVCSGAQPGSIFKFDARAERIPGNFFNYSTHAFSVAEAVELARTLDSLPEKLLVFGIEGEDFGSGPGLSESVKQAVWQVVEEAAGLIQEQRFHNDKAEPNCA